MSRIKISKNANSTNFIYLLKCLTGVIICYALYKAFPQYPFYWALVSVVVSLSPDSSNTLAYDRMKANMIGCAAGICMYPLHLPNLVILCFGVTLTIFIGITLRMTNTLKTALAAVVIITLQEEHEKHWYIALERVTCVVTGCLVALAVTLLFNLLTSKRYSKQ
ncbi:FUSC family protein [Pedobacter sp. PAMC26386]|nr:FUSC family protein [Pedobacter sp. PAMC26386]